MAQSIVIYLTLLFHIEDFVQEGTDQVLYESPSGCPKLTRNTVFVSLCFYYTLDVL